jgi:PhnB protein
VIMKQSQMMPRQSAEQAGKEDNVVHARMSFAGVELIGNDVPADSFLPIRSSYLYLALDSSEDAERVYGVLAKEGKVSMPIAETPFASRFAQLRDRFGVLWIRSALDHYSSASQGKLKTGNSQFPRSGNERCRLPSALTP